MAHRSWVLQLVALAIHAPIAAAQALAGDEPGDQRRRLIEQKIRLVESLIAAPSPRTPGAGEVPTLLATGQADLERARTALAAHQWEAASAALDAALRSAIKAAHLSASKSEAHRREQAAYAGLAEQVATFRAALEDLSRQGNRAAAAGVADIGRLQDAAGKLAAAGQWTEANRRLRDAYRDATVALSELRAGQTVTLNLAFATPRDEYEYEGKRYQSTRLLVDMMIDDGRAAGERRQLVAGFAQEAGKLREAAVAQAGNGDYPGAVATMEGAVGRLNRALQAMGIAAF